MISHIHKENLMELSNNISEAIRYITEYSSKTPDFLKYLIIMKKNIQICIECNYDGIEELSKYLCEDWRQLFKGNDGIESWYIPIDNIDLKACTNIMLEDCLEKIDRLLNVNFFIKRKWYSEKELKNMGKSFYQYKKNWNSIINDIQKNNGCIKSPITQIPNDIWMFAKYFLCVASTDEILKKWFFSDIPAFGYIAPVEMTKLENGNDILRTFLVNAHLL
ncbi:MAG: hypothetical protein K2N51_03655 [Lachnospiraceae bacterium]|nr:hypothetical protein [Lachnospiraceae bacterium]